MRHRTAALSVALLLLPVLAGAQDGEDGAAPPAPPDDCHGIGIDRNGNEVIDPNECSGFEEVGENRFAVAVGHQASMGDVMEREARRVAGDPGRLRRPGHDDRHWRQHG